MKKQGKVPYGTNSTYVVYRNVKDYGAKGIDRGIIRDRRLLIL